MKYISLILIVLSLTFSCFDNNQEKIYQKLQGDWLYNDIYNSNQFISFRNKKFFAWDYQNEFSSFYLTKDSIIVPFYNFRLKYLKVTDKYIWINDNGKEFPLLFNTNIFCNKDIKLKSIEIRFINFWHRGLLDWGLYFDENLNCFLKVERTYKSKQIENPLPYEKGNYFARLTPATFEFYQNKFRNLPLELIDDLYKSEDYDPDGSCVKHDDFFVEFNSSYSFTNSDKKREVHFVSQGMNNIPGFLNVLILHLNKIHDFVSFSSTNNLFDFKYYQDSLYYNFAK